MSGDCPGSKNACEYAYLTEEFGIPCLGVNSDGDCVARIIVENAQVLHERQQAAASPMSTRSKKLGRYVGRILDGLSSVTRGNLHTDLTTDINIILNNQGR